MSAPEPPAEARLIASARQALVPRLSQRQAAARAGISATRWRQLEAGIIRVHGHDYPESAPPDTLARMAQVAGVTPGALREAGRADAADYLSALAARGITPPDENEDAIRAMDWLTPAEQDALLVQYRRRRNQQRAG